MGGNAKRIEAARAFARKHDPDPAHAGQVCKLSGLLFDALGDLHGLGDTERLLLQAAALMHDVGYDARPGQHHKGSRDLILASHLEGFTRKQLMVMACVARYHRKGLPEDDHKVYRDLDEKGRATVRKLASLLRIADGLDRSHVSSAEFVHVDRLSKGIRFSVIQRSQNRADIEAALKKSDLFEEVYKLGVEIIFK